MKKTAMLCLTAVLCALSPVQANIIWSNSSGSADFFDWQNGQSLNGLFGDPMLVGGNTLVFFPSNFRAEATDGQTAAVSDRLEFELILHAGFSLDNISVTEYGDYGILGTGQVDVSGAVSAQNMDTTDIINSSLATTYYDQGTWQGQALLDIVPPDWTRVKITLENDLFAIAGCGSVAWIEKKVIGNAIAIQIIPEPATVAMLTIGSLLMLRNSRSKKNKLKI